jgi:uncharacterized lipoprotein YddW (UPF0748 family)
VQDYSLSVVLDVVRRYDVDGIHFDDYFYPYKEKDPSGAELDFPDAAAWEKFGAGGKLSREDWRRENVNVFIRRVYESIKATKPWVKFGVSPFGIWRPGYPAQIRGYDSFAKLYADSRKWLASGWLDYFVPQLYWAIGPTEQSFPVLLKWWVEQNSKGRNIYAGMDSTKAGNPWQPEEIINQIRLVRAPGGGMGEVHWNASALAKNPKLDVALERDVYAEPALVPASPWLGRATLERPALKVNAGRSHPKFEWSAGAGNEPWQWVVQTEKAGGWTTKIVQRGTKSLTWSGALPEVFAVSGVDRNGNLSQAAVLELKR